MNPFATEEMKIGRSARIPCADSKCTFACLDAGSTGGRCLDSQIC